MFEFYTANSKLAKSTTKLREWLDYNSVGTVSELKLALTYFQWRLHVKSIKWDSYGINKNNFTIDFNIIHENSIHGVIVYRMFIGFLATYNSSMPSRYDYILLKIIRAQFVMTIIIERKTPSDKCHWMSNATQYTQQTLINTSTPFHNNLYENKNKIWGNAQHKTHI